ncbi:hypothetical protein V6N11_050741 [Hibiscus sabdariffa]|uniref:Uncharacterized protein n=1 Tax=Hibiscus sabdariffa TaxID=183260 RepID=A0ABR2TBP3_9ROSI
MIGISTWKTSGQIQQRYCVRNGSRRAWWVLGVPLPQAQRPWRWCPLLVSIDLLVKKIANVQLCFVNSSNNRLAEGLAKDDVSRVTFFKAWW